MKIASIVVHRLSVPLRRPVRTAIHDLTHAHTVLVEMQSDAGLVGSGYCFAFGRRAAGALHELVLDLAPLYVGKNPVRVQATHAADLRALISLGHAVSRMTAPAALDVACWDLAARSADLPLYRYLGGARNRVPTYASSGLWIDYSIDDLLAEADRFRAQGHQAMKMRIGRSRAAEDVERVRRLREAVGPGVHLLADVNQGWDEPTALRVGRQLEAYDLYWLEEPLPYQDLEGCARVSSALTMRVATGESDYGSRAMKRHLELHVADVLMPDLQRMRGVNAFMKAATLFDAYHQPGSFRPLPGTSWPRRSPAPHR